jgi:quinol monooxygenase YgiN
LLASLISLSQNEPMIVVIGQFNFHPDDFEAARALAATLMQETVQEDGCIKYAFAEDLVQRSCLQLNECWRDDAALSAHFLTPHIQAFRDGLKSLRMEKRVVKRYEVSASSDL